MDLCVALMACNTEIHGAFSNLNFNTKHITMRYFLFALLITLLLAGCGLSTPKNNDTPTQVLTDEELLDTVQYYTFQYFWEGAEPNSGMARERLHIDGHYPENDAHIVTTGGTGFGLMAIIAGIERGFITRQKGFERLTQVVDFLEKADRFHGVWPHWLDGQTGKVKPFSTNDNGGDLVETAFLVQGLLTVKQYLADGNNQEQQLAQKIDQLWREVEWNWHTKGGENILYWHWSPDKQWAMNHKIHGYDECMVTYILAASSPTFPIEPQVYHEGWADSGAISIEAASEQPALTLRHRVNSDMGGPLFWAHYSFLGLDPRGLSDQYADYWANNVAHTLLNRQHCIDNPHNYKGYGKNCWGLTFSYSVPGASDYFNGQTNTKPDKGNSQETDFACHCPSFDLGVIVPTAAISSIPYAPNKVMPVIRYFYENMANKLFGKYGFYDAFSDEYNWYPKRYLAIDQGPIVVMIENHRTGLIWDLFMQNTDVHIGLKKLGFSSPHLN